MGDVVKLTKRDIRAKAGETKAVALEALQGNEVEIRRLKTGEWEEIEPATSEGVKLSGKPNRSRKDEDGNEDEMGGMEMSVDVKASSKGEAFARKHIAACGLSCNGESWSVEDISDLDMPGFVREVAQAILVYSGLREGELEEAKSVRENAGGGGDGDPAPERGAHLRGVDSGELESPASDVFEDGDPQGTS